MRLALNSHVFSSSGKGVLLLLLLALAPSVGVASAPIEVTTREDVVRFDGDCSLREALINAETRSQAGSAECASGIQGPNLILLPAGRFVIATSAERESFLLTGDLDITTDVTLIGPEKGESVLVASGQGDVFDVSGAGRLDLKGVRVERSDDAGDDLAGVPAARALATTPTPSIRVAIIGIAYEQQPGAVLQDRNAVYRITNNGTVELSSVSFRLSSTDPVTKEQEPITILGFAPPLAQADRWNCLPSKDLDGITCTLRGSSQFNRGESVDFVATANVAQMHPSARFDEEGEIHLSAAGYALVGDRRVRVDDSASAQFLIKVPPEQLQEAGQSASAGVAGLLFMAFCLFRRRKASRRKGAPAVDTKESPCVCCPGSGISFT